uniref:Zinc finger protein n=1 Tax=Panagrellus redivivus TaxID=6233 RepID=A0A7E4UM61_PANRE
MVQPAPGQHQIYADQNYVNQVAIKYEPMDAPACDLRVKYEPNDNSPGAVLDYTTALPTVNSHSSTSPYSTSTPAPSFHGSPESDAAARMNGVIQSVSQGAGSDPHSLQSYRGSRSSDELSSISPDGLPSVQQVQQKPVMKAADRRHARGRPNNDRKRPYPCKMCPSKFGSKMELEEHQNSHTGQKPFECEKCSSRFNRRSTLWNHKRIHSEQKPFICSVCKMRFKWKNSLKCHKEMHIRKNEINDATDGDIRQLTYATAAKKKLLEQEGGDISKMNSLTIFSANPSTSEFVCGQDDLKLSKKKVRTAKKAEPQVDRQKQAAESEAALNSQLFENSFLNFNNNGNLSMDLSFDPNNIDFMNMNNNLLMEALLNNTDFTLDANGKDLLSPLTTPISSINVPLPFIKNYANVDLNHLSSTLNHDLMRPDPLPSMNHFNPSINVNDAYNHDILPGNYNCGLQNGGVMNGSNASSSSTPSSMSHSTIHGMPDLSYNPHDGLLLNHQTNDYNMNNGFGWPGSGTNGYSQHSIDMPLSALSVNDPLDQCLVHHPGCLNSHMSGMH